MDKFSYARSHCLAGINEGKACIIMWHA